MKPGKTRVVFDCAAKLRGMSLNDHLLKGPDLTSSIVGVLKRFRHERVALAVDVEAMFHPVMSQEPFEYRMEVHSFGATSLPACSNFALRKSAEDNIKEFDEEVVETVKKNFYVDDYLKSVESSVHAVKLASQLRELLSRGGFRLRKWLSNRPKAMETISERERASSVLDLDLDKERHPVERTLDLRWDMQNDISFSAPF
ncbi:hypothetical protein ACROYT_G035176 [Oculina patagonica]